MKCTQTSSGAGEGNISLPVLETNTGGQAIKSSKASWWRAGVLIAVHIIILVHVAHWLLYGMTLSPIEPSDSMYTLELGRVNLGFIFFVLALLSTFVFGRVFCGWGCHIIAIQDLCTWILAKFKIHPKPFRSRLLVWCPLLLAIYMFVVPTFRREVMLPLFKAMKWSWLPEFGAVVPRQPFTNATLVDNLWATMPPWYVFIPFLFVCGFAIVYFLGNKAFCSFGCPYGGFFGLTDRFALGKIKVNEKCEQCGHCTAACTSNVRVHEQVRDYGQVIDPGCMKTLDCVSVCPNGALSYGFGAPNLMARPRNAEAATRVKSASKSFDMSLGQDVLLFVFGLVMFCGYRGLANQIPLLMAGGLAAITVYFGWAVLQLAMRANVRVAHMQAKLKGRIQAGGYLTILLAVAFIGTGAWGAAVNFNLWRAEMLDLRVEGEFERVFSKEYKPDAATKERAEAALRHFRTAGPWSEGGIGWSRLPSDYKRMAWLAAVAGDLKQSEQWLRVAGTKPAPVADTFTGVVRIMEIQGRPRTEQIEFLREALKANPKMHELRMAYFNKLFEDGQLMTAGVEVDAFAAASKDDAAGQHLAGMVYRVLNRGPQALAAFARAVELDPKVGIFQYDLAIAHGMGGDLASAEKRLIDAAKLEPENVHFLQTLAQFYRDIGNNDRAKEYDGLVAELIKRTGQGGDAPAPPGK